MQTTVTNPAIISFLKSKFPGAGFVDGLKIKYRSLICPFTNLIQMVKPGDKVGDVGCGSGQFLLLLTEFAEPQEVFGIEISDKLIDNAQRLFSSIPHAKYHFEQFDGAVFPAKLAEMDLIFLIDVFHHVPKASQEKFMQDLIARMKPGARLVLKDINADSPLVLCNKMHDLVFAGEIGHEMSFNRAKEMLTSNGLQILQQEKRTMYVYPHYTFVAKK